MTNHARIGLVQVCAAGILWGTGGLAVQLIRQHSSMTVLTVSAWRMLLASAVLVATVLIGRHLGAMRTALRQNPGRAAFVGAMTGSYQALYFWAVVEVGVTVATVVSLGLAPVLLTVWEARVQRPSAKRVLVLLGALLGLVLVSLSAHAGLTGPRPAVGISAAVLSGTAYAIATQVGRPLTASTPPLILTTMATASGAVLLSVLAVFGGGPYLPNNLPAVLLIGYLAIFTMALAYALFYAGLRTTTGSAAVIATLLEPVTAGVVAWLLLGERIGLVGIVGMALILAAVAGLGERVETAPDDG